MVQPELAGYRMSVELWTLLFLGSGSLLVLGLLAFIRPSINRQTILALTPWAVTGSAVHALFTVNAYPDQFALLFGPRAVYMTTWIVAGMVWAMMATAVSFERTTGTDAQYLTAGGVGAAVATVAAVMSQGFGADLQGVLVTVGALVASLVVASVAYVAFSYLYSKALIETGLLGWLLIFGHVLDGATTAVAIDVRNIPGSYRLSRQIADFAATLPTAETIGVGWSIVLVRLVLAMIVVAGVAHLLSRYLKDREQVGYVFLGIVIAFGLGPAFHHLLMLMVVS